VTKHDVTNAVATALSALAILLQVLVGLMILLGLFALVSERGRRWLVEARESLFGSELWLAWLIAAVATAGSLFFSEYSNFIPCRLCWYQRIFMYPMAIVLLGTALRRDVRGAFLYAIWLPIIGIGVSAYHIYIEYHPEAETAGCKVGAPCTIKWIDKFGYITLPVLAASAFAAIITLLLLAWSRRDGPAGADPPPASVPA
jgi:disulfide bond formation protein DsbB